MSRVVLNDRIVQPHYSPTVGTLEVSKSSESCGKSVWRRGEWVRVVGGYRLVGAEGSEDVVDTKVQE